MNREQSSDNLKWNLLDIFSSHSEWEKEFDFLNMEMEKFSSFKNKLNNKEVLLSFFKFEDEFNARYEKLNCYTYLNHDINLKDMLYIEDLEKLNILEVKLLELTTFVMPELKQIDNEFFYSLLKDECFCDYRYNIENIIMSKKHILSLTQEETLSVTNKYSGGFSDINDALTADFKFEPVLIDGQIQQLNEGTYGKFIRNSNSEIRELAYNNLYKTYNQFANTLASNYINFLKMTTSELKLRNETDLFYSTFYTEKISRDLYNKLISNVNNNIGLEKEYFILLKQKHNIKDLTFKDVYLSLVGENNSCFNIEKQKEIVLNALTPLGEEYISVLKDAYNNNWIDFCVGENKQSGGYMLGVYGVHPFVLLNDNENYDSLTTLIHELGHAMHTYYSNKTQTYSNHDYSTFIAEIASTVNEILLNKYLYNNAKSDEEKLFYLSHYIENFKSTVFRQVMFSEFEDFAIKTIENDEILSENILTEYYKRLIKKHFDGVVEIDNNIIHEWARIPHFYTPYYVFQYATSFVSAVYIATSLLENTHNMKEKYFEMLKSGSNGYPTEILLNAGVDLTKDETYFFAFNDLKNALIEAKVLLKKTKKTVQLNP